jgi:hypothetical protein
MSVGNTGSSAGQVNGELHKPHPPRDGSVQRIIRPKDRENTYGNEPQLPTGSPVDKRKTEVEHSTGESNRVRPPEVERHGVAPRRYHAPRNQGNHGPAASKLPYGNTPIELNGHGESSPEGSPANSPRRGSGIGLGTSGDA